MQGVRGCFGCKRDRRANENHSREEVTKAVNRWKEKHPTAFLSCIDLEYIDQIFTDKYEGGHKEEGDDAYSEN